MTGCLDLRACRTAKRLSTDEFAFDRAELPRSAEAFAGGAASDAYLF